MSGLPKNATDEMIEEYFENNGLMRKTVKVCNVNRAFNIGDYVKLAREKVDLLRD